jgi:D-glycero-alpha-D-manno-heptose 1-phosphate guanylyltransferase
MNFKDIDVIILCGGRGKRLPQITKDIPKPLAEIKGQPFLDIVITYLALFGFKRFILCTGYKSEVIENYYKYKILNNIDIVFSKENKPLGTAGAIKNAERFLQSRNFLVINGDSFCKTDLLKFYSFHLRKKALGSMVLTKIESSGDVGEVVLGIKYKIKKFSEKCGNKDRQCYVNAGIYFFNKNIFLYLPSGNEKFSLEYDLFPKLANKEIYGYVVDSKLIDIGTPQGYKRAQRILNLYITKRS